MTHNQNSRIKYMQLPLLLILSIGLWLSGCAGPKDQPGTNGQPPLSESPTVPDSNTPNAAVQPSPMSPTSPTGNTPDLPEGVSVTKVIKDITIDQNKHKRVELLSDGGKRVLITDPNGNILVGKIEYEGKILAVNGRQVTVQVDRGTQKTITIPNHIDIEDDNNLGLNKGVDIEWELDLSGTIQDVELED